MLSEEVRREGRFVGQNFLHSFYIIIIRDHPPVTLGVDVYVAANSSWAPQLAQLLTPRTYGRSEATARCSSKEEFSTLEPKWLRILRIRLLAHLHPLIIRCQRRLRTRLRSYRLVIQMLRDKLPPAGLLDSTSVALILPSFFFVYLSIYLSFFCLFSSSFFVSLFLSFCFPVSLCKWGKRKWTVI